MCVPLCAFLRPRGARATSAVPLVPRGSWNATKRPRAQTHPMQARKGKLPLRNFQATSSDSFSNLLAPHEETTIADLFEAHTNRILGWHPKKHTHTYLPYIRFPSLPPECCQPQLPCEGPKEGNRRSHTFVYPIFSPANYPHNPAGVIAEPAEPDSS